jgi:hypothetical protein
MAAYSDPSMLIDFIIMMHSPPYLTKAVCSWLEWLHSLCCVDGIDQLGTSNPLGSDYISRDFSVVGRVELLDEKPTAV